MPAKKFIVEPNAVERGRLIALISKGKSTAKTILKARILLKADQATGGPGWRDAQLVEALDTNPTMVSRTGEKRVTDGLDALLTRKKRETPPTPAIFDGEAQAKLTALACSEPPPGHRRWNIRLLAEQVVERRIVPAAHFNTDVEEHASGMTARSKKRPQAAPDRLLGDPAESQRRLRRGDGGRARRPQATARPGPTAGLPRPDVQAARRRDARARTHAAGTARAPRLRVQTRPCEVGLRHDGTANLFLLFAPLALPEARKNGGWRHIEVTAGRTAIDYTKILRDPADIHFPSASRIVLVQHNLNTHMPASLHEAFEPAEARRPVERFERHFTPKHGSWLNLAESELAVLAGPCLARRIPDATTLASEVAAWRCRRNTHNVKAKWHFTTAEARAKLKSLYPSL